MKLFSSLLHRNNMNIWDAYCKPAYYNFYFKTLIARGEKSSNVDKLKQHYCAYLQRIKGSMFATELKTISTPEEFKTKLDDIFGNRWRNHIQYKEMPYHYKEYLHFLDIIQVIYNDFINEEEKERLTRNEPDIPLQELTSYETKYLINNKLVALTNPYLLRRLREYIEEEKLPLRRASILCKTFYGNLLPEMETSDYRDLVENIWSPSRTVKKKSKSNMKVIFPDKEMEFSNLLEGMKEIIKYYDIRTILEKKLAIRGEKLVVKYIPMGKEKCYVEFNDCFYIYKLGNRQDRINAINAINRLCGNKLKIEF